MTTREMATQSDRSVEIRRFFAASPRDVFFAWIDPEQVKQWFAPKPLTVPRAEIDAWPGGAYTIVMRDPDGTEYTSTGVYEEVVDGEKIVETDSIESMPQEWRDEINARRGEPAGTMVPDGIVTVTFTEVPGGTEVTYREDFDSGATRDVFVEKQMVEGLEMTLDTLEELLTKSPTMSR